MKMELNNVLLPILFIVVDNVTRLRDYCCYAITRLRAYARFGALKKIAYFCYQNLRLD